MSTGAPLTDVPPGGRHWYLVPRVGYPDPATFAHSYELLTGFLDRLLGERGIDWDRTVIGGFSMGAVMSYAVGLGPERPSPAAILAFSGFVPTVEGWAPALDDRAGLPVLIHHGRNDPVIPVEFGRRAAELLAAPASTSATWSRTPATGCRRILLRRSSWSLPSRPGRRPARRRRGSRRRCRARRTRGSGGPARPGRRRSPGRGPRSAGSRPRRRSRR